MSAAQRAEKQVKQGRRRHQRVLLNTTVDLTSDSNFYTGFVENISNGGVFVATDQPAEPGSEVMLGLDLPDGGEPIEARVVVRWIREPNQRNDVAPGFGAEFVSLDDAVAERINQFIATRDPIFFV